VHERGFPELREVVVGNYRVIYRLNDQWVEILTIVHASRHFGDDSATE
jgi:plasmid stabilization system protein ParE